MKATVGILLATAGLSTAQVIKNGNGTYTCALSSGTYCTSTSLESNMIIRCNGGIGYASSCDERLADKAPLGSQYAPCWQTSARSGNAQCSKNGMIYPDGNNTTPYPVPNYQTISASISSAATATTEATKWPYVANFTTTTTTSTTTNTHTTLVYLSAVIQGAYSNSSSPYYNNATLDDSLTEAAAAVSATTMPYLPYFPAPVIPTSTQYTTDMITSYTTICPAGATITNSAGSESVLATRSTITVTTTTRSTITATAIVSFHSPVFAFDTSSMSAAASQYAPVVTEVAAAPYVWANETWSNATTLVVVGTSAPVAVAPASTSTSAHYPPWNETVIPFTGTASKTGVSLSVLLAALMTLL
ncbi:hypothetical protein AUEXF2481DRAFT_25100 [Aureobasidium subglaciale EXF-2481]|uniref:Uncharacterized protein n=1 Tax=Aureobasidium subglaciale (strain EXF-2481) TaxID=1043005 RepID=A0A074YT02_AURSE|nr:uncharacterized protein AUEXF2481DRAFT_25100 [Aureobasidium subglaciale EXF-2481]KAI5210337.1 hypothetical protein E4T38_01977 [Aureobasidium subglaciale]KAI5228886.1 hypothetical protein E4T40_01916 [Aureobasidium subglaciale]KAI5232802.1 hypothetical protein E4T41_02136 [Aureobasidium subglaciale]KAI5265961.1 hypothetical protein E4T46_01754 [Aureobasidium subglaciale]KER00816.1 hypothetical protein AUEXF2481DRAFT_25100 [Aureobasidium subglaciale EXF-2481]